MVKSGNQTALLTRLESLLENYLLQLEHHNELIVSFFINQLHRPSDVSRNFEKEFLVFTAIVTIESLR